MANLIVVMGVSGAGKSTLGIRLARELGWEFIEADDFHSDEAIAQMQAGIPLNDEQREPWIARIEAHLKRTQQPSVLAYSGLISAQRERVAASASRSRFIYLECQSSIAASRVSQRHHHFMSSKLVGSQFDALQQPANDQSILTLDASQDLNRLATQAIFWLSEDDFLLTTRPPQ